jgi:hypothetical protein
MTDAFMVWQLLRCEMIIHLHSVSGFFTCCVYSTNDVAVENNL